MRKGVKHRQQPFTFISDGTAAASSVVTCTAIFRQRTDRTKVERALKMTSSRIRCKIVTVADWHLNHTQLSITRSYRQFHNVRAQSCVIKQTIAYSLCSLSVYSLNMLDHCVEWNKFVLRIFTYPLR